MADDAAPSSDFSRIYCYAMLLVSAFLGYMLWKTAKDASAYETANESAKNFFGSADPSPSQEVKPTQIRFLGVGILKYIETYKAATLKGPATVDIPVEKVKERAKILGLEVYQYAGDNIPTKNAAKGYEESTLNVTFEKTDLNHLATFLYNFEVSSTNLRTLEVKWDLLPEKENPPSTTPGYLIQRPTVKIGLRRPLAGRAK